MSEETVAPSDGRPGELQVELAGLCNAACEYCDWQGRPTPQKKFMDTAMAKKIVAEAKSLGVRQISFHITGESLMHPDVLDIMPRDYPILLSSNCLLLDGEIAKDLAERQNLILIMAMLWPEPDARREKSIMNAFNYLKMKPKNRAIYAQFISSEKAFPHAERFYHQFNHFLNELPQLSLHFKQPYTQEAHRPTKGYITDQVPEGPRVQIDRMPTPQSCGPDCVAFAPNPDSDILVQSDGQIKPCFKRWDGWNLGNAADTTLLEAWNSPRFAEIRTIWRKGDPDNKLACHDCIRMAVPEGLDGKKLPVWWSPENGGTGHPPRAFNADQTHRNSGWICPKCGRTHFSRPAKCACGQPSNQVIVTDTQW